MSILHGTPMCPGPGEFCGYAHYCGACGAFYTASAGEQTRGLCPNCRRNAKNARIREALEDNQWTEYTAVAVCNLGVSKWTHTTIEICRAAVNHYRAAVLKRADPASREATQGKEGKDA